MIIVVIAIKAWTGSGTPLRGGLPSGHAALAFAAWIAITYVAGPEPSLPGLDDRVRRWRCSSPRPGSSRASIPRSRSLLGGLLGALLTLAIFQSRR